MAIKDLEKDRAKFAYQCVVEVNGNEKIKKDYKSYVKKIPMMILNNGLGATFAFIYSKKQKSEAYELIYKQVDDWLNKDYKSTKCNKTNDCYEGKDKDCKEVDLVRWMTCLNSQPYRATTNELLALFNWLKRFADGMIEGEENAN